MGRGERGYVISARSRLFISAHRIATHHRALRSIKPS